MRPTRNRKYSDQDATLNEHGVSLSDRFGRRKQSADPRHAAMNPDTRAALAARAI
jgi:hypothetical protein